MREEPSCVRVIQFAGYGRTDSEAMEATIAYAQEQQHGGDLRTCEQAVIDLQHKDHRKHAQWEDG